jgi:hypothetical protein
MVAPTIAIAGSVAQLPQHGGHTWVFLQYLLGFRRLGYDVLFIDRLEPGMCVDEGGRPAEFARSLNLRYLQEVMDRFGLGDSWTLRYDGGREVAGLGHARVVERLARSELLVNVMGFLDDPALLAAAPRRVFLDIDPGFGQMWKELGLDDVFAGHDDHVTIGENIGRPDCAIPTCGIEWITTKQPVVLDEWPATAHGRRTFTSVGSWRGPFGPIEHRGRTYGLRVHEFRRFVELPERTALDFEVALDIADADAADRRCLDDNGWTLVDPRRVASDPWSYRDYVSGSGAELMVAKNLYVATRSGWFSDRSICYLASGRPVLAQDTGLAALLPAGAGIVTFATIDEAVAGAHAIDGDYDRHARAAREIASEVFDSDRVLSRLLERLGVR